MAGRAVSTGTSTPPVTSYADEWPDRFAQIIAATVAKKRRERRWRQEHNARRIPGKAAAHRARLARPDPPPEPMPSDPPDCRRQYRQVLDEGDGWALYAPLAGPAPSTVDGGDAP